MYYSALPHGIGSLVGQGNSSINQVTNERTTTNESEDYYGMIWLKIKRILFKLLYY